MRRWWSLVVLLAAAPAWAQSKKYPPEPIDKDLERERQSDLWDQALSPQSKSYSDLVKEAKHHYDERSPDEKTVAIETLDHAIALLPNATDAYVLRGQTHLAIADARARQHGLDADALKQWSQCADDLAVADDRLGTGQVCSLKIDESCLIERTELRRELAICQSRAGHYAEAERTFIRAVGVSPQGAPGAGELWTRLGEVRIAMGKLDEGIAALDTASDLTPDGPSESFIHWLLAVAYDRRRQPSDADKQVDEALRYDRVFSTIETPNLPLLGAGEREYLLGLAWRTVRPEYALLYFRRFVKIAGDSPWRKRADEHERELAGIELPSSVVRESGNAALDVAAARSMAKKAMPAMRACMEKLPFSAYQVSITKVGPRTDRPIFKPPKAGVTILSPFTVSGADAMTPDTLTSQRCIEALAEHLAMPAAAEKDSWYKASFYVVSP